MKYRKKPVVIDAEQFNYPAITNPGLVRTNDFFMEFSVWIDHQGPHLKIPTLEGEMRANPGDWVIIGVKGERYPCKPDIFAATYEPAEPPPCYDPIKDTVQNICQGLS